ncbi:MAG: TlpA disulfide reductase family protein [Kofleriaceae bacterium]
MITPTPSRSNVTAGTKALIGILLAGTAGILIFLFVHLSGSSGRPTIGTAPAAASCTKGKDCLPDVSYIDVHGTAYTPKSLAGKVVVVNFWATWCKPCLKEIPDIAKIYEKYKGRGVVVLGVLTNDNADADTVMNFTSDNEMTFPVIRANADIMASYSYPSSLPTTFIFDRGGKQVQSHVGALRAERLADMLEPLVQQN